MTYSVDVAGGVGLVADDELASRAAARRVLDEVVDEAVDELAVVDVVRRLGEVVSLDRRVALGAEEGGEDGIVDDRVRLELVAQSVTLLDLVLDLVTAVFEDQRVNRCVELPQRLVTANLPRDLLLVCGLLKADQEEGRKGGKEERRTGGKETSALDVQETRCTHQLVVGFLPVGRKSKQSWIERGQGRTHLAQLRVALAADGRTHPVVPDLKGVALVHEVDRVAFLPLHHLPALLAELRFRLEPGNTTVEECEVVDDAAEDGNDGAVVVREGNVGLGDVGGERDGETRVVVCVETDVRKVSRVLEGGGEAEHSRFVR